MSKQEYDHLMKACADVLPDGEFWCIIDPGGVPMVETASKRLDEPVIMFCSALKCDWEDAKEVGYRLGRTS